MAGFTAGLLQLVGDERARQRMGFAARATAANNHVSMVARQWEELLVLGQAS